MLSKYVSSIKLKKDLYAVYNNLVCSPVFLNKREKEMLFAGEWGWLKNDQLELLKELGIFVNNPTDDVDVWNLLSKSINENLKNKIFLMYIIPTNTCNLKCTYCFIGKTACGSNVQFMENDTLIAAIDKYNKHLKEANIKQGEIIFYGGEPTICWNQIVLAKKHIISKKYNIVVSMVTNASILDEKMLDDIKELKIGVSVSIDGPKHVTDKNRLFKQGDFSVYSVVMQNMQKLSERGIDFSLSVTLSEYFINNQKEALDWLIKLNVPSINFNLMRFSDSNCDWKSYYKKATKFLIKAYELLKSNRIQDDRVHRKVESFHNRQFKFSDCAAMGGNQLTIRPNGDVCVCHGYWNSERDNCGNIKTQSFKEIMASPAYKEWANYISIKKKKCKNCKYIYTCGGGCAQQSEVLFGGRDNVDKSFCYYTKETFKWILLKFYLENAKN